MIKRCLWGLLFSLLSINSFAALELELTQGVDKAIPIAVEAFSGDDKVISQVIRTDLRNSGQFRLVKIKNSKQLDFNRWREAGIDNVVRGQIKPLAAGQYQVTVELIDVLGKDPILLKQQFTINAANARSFAHHLSDLIFEKLTGIKGVFSTRIAYVLVDRKPKQQPKYMLEVADADGFNPQSLVVSNQPIMSPRWSPDSKQIAYVSFENMRAEVFVVDVATGKRRLITTFPRINGAPSWSPDGQHLALVLSKTGAPKIYTVNIANGLVKQLTEGISIDTEPAWTPDGQSIVFTSNRGGGPQIYQVSAKGGRAKRLTYVGNYNARATITPDGKKMVMMHRDKGKLFTIAVQDLKTGYVQELTDPQQLESPSLSPNGKMVLYATQRGNDNILSVVSVDGKVKLDLPAEEGAVQEPAWSNYL